MAELSVRTENNGNLKYSKLKSELNKEFGETGYIISPERYNPWKIIVGDVEYEISSNGKIKIALETENKGTAPYFPSSKFKVLDGTDLSTGLVITDKTDNEEMGNEYVWIEVPSTYLDSTVTTGPDYSNVSGETDYENIATALRIYCTKDASNADLITLGTNLSSSSKTTTRGFTDTYHSGCGIPSEEAYTTLYNKMLKSIYENGGFWIGRYEAGTTTPRESRTDLINGLTPLSKINLYPINYVTCSQAQTIAENVPNKGIYNSSLMFGIQWDLVLRHLSNKGVATSLIITNSSTWGNYSNHTFEINRGKYSIASPWNVYIDYKTESANKVTFIEGKSTKVGTSGTNQILLTTGSAEVNSQKNIYDLAGNVFEWTLEENPLNSYSCVQRGGGYGVGGSYDPASWRGYDSTTSSFSDCGLRITLY